MTMDHLPGKRYQSGCRCEACKKKKSEEGKLYDEPERRRAAARARYELNKERILSRNRQWAEANPDKVLASRRRYRERNREYFRDRGRKDNLWRKYKLTIEAYNALLTRQEGGCAICGKTDSGHYQFSVDHDHSCCPGTPTCGQCVRGLLCGPCNRALGHLENMDFVTAAASYLGRTRRASVG